MSLPATRVRLASSMDDGLSGTRHDRGRLHQHIEVVERIAGFDEGHPVPFERLLDEQRRAKLLVERPRAFVAGDHPDDETVGAVRALRVSDRRYELAPDTRALELALNVCGRQFRIDVVARLLQHVPGGETDDIAVVLRYEHARLIRPRGQHPMPQR